MAPGITPSPVTARASPKRLAPRDMAPPTTEFDKPVGVTEASSKKSPKPHIRTLRAKLILANSTLVKPQIKEDATKHYRQLAQQPWIVDAAFKDRFYVLDGSTWDLKQYGLAWEAELMSSKNPPIDAGNGVWIYVKDDEKYLAAMKAIVSASKVMQGACLGALGPPVNVIRKEERRGMGVKQGSCLYLKVAETVERIKADDL